MKDCLALYVPSNLGETNLFIGIAPGWGGYLRNPFTLDSVSEHEGENCIFDKYRCDIMANNVKDAQQGVIKMSRQLEDHYFHPNQSDRLYFLPLFTGICYQLAVEPKKQRERAVVRVAYDPECPTRTWLCKIYASNLVQLQEALFVHEQSLLKKRLQILKQRRVG